MKGLETSVTEQGAPKRTRFQEDRSSNRANYCPQTLEHFIDLRRAGGMGRGSHTVHLDQMDKMEKG